MTDRFRFLDLNEDCVKTVLQCFDGFDLISFSLCSKKRLANVRSLKLHFEVHLCSGNTFYARFNFGKDLIKLYFCEDGYDRGIALTDFQPRRLQVDYIEGRYPYEHLHRHDANQEPTIRRWRKANYRGKDWLRHIMSIFNCDKIRSLSVEQSKFEFPSLMDTVRNLNILKLLFFETISTEHTLELLNALPCVEEVDVHSLTCRTPSEYSVLLRNQQFLLVQIRTLDMMLYVNSLTLYCKGLTIKEVNRFIKLWQNGANSNLRFLQVSFYRHRGAAVLNENEVLGRVRYQRMPQGAVRMFEVFDTRLEVIGGFDIVGKTGRKATVTLYNHGWVSFFKMFNWQ